MRKYAVAILLLFLTLSCGIESVQTEVSLRPPLGVKATNVANQIQLSFWSWNVESYFDGFRIYVATTIADAIGEYGNGRGNEISNLSGELNKPALANLRPMAVDSTGPSNFIVLIAKNYNGTDFVPGSLYYFYVKATSTIHGVNSVASDIASIHYTPAF